MLEHVDTRVVFLLVWGGGCLFTYGTVLARRVRSWRVHHDTRARRDLMSGFALFLTAFAAAAAITFVLFGEAGTGIRGFFTAMALGAFVANGAVMAREEQAEVLA